MLGQLLVKLSNHLLQLFHQLATKSIDDQEFLTFVNNRTNAFLQFLLLLNQHPFHQLSLNSYQALNTFLVRQPTLLANEPFCLKLILNLKQSLHRIHFLSTPASMDNENEILQQQYRHNEQCLLYVLSEYDSEEQFFWKFFSQYRSELQKFIKSFIGMFFNDSHAGKRTEEDASRYPYRLSFSFRTFNQYRNDGSMFTVDPSESADVSRIFRATHPQQNFTVDGRIISISLSDHRMGSMLSVARSCSVHCSSRTIFVFDGDHQISSKHRIASDEQKYHWPVCTFHQVLATVHAQSERTHPWPCSESSSLPVLYDPTWFVFSDTNHSTTIEHLSVLSGTIDQWVEQCSLLQMKMPVSPFS